MNIAASLPIVSQFRHEIEYVLALWQKNSGKSGRETKEMTQVYEKDLLFLNHSGIAWTIDGLSKVRPGKEGYISSDHGPEYLLTAFYFINSLQEYSKENLDSLGRFQYEGSLQQRFNLFDANIVQQCFDKISEALNVTPTRQKTRFFLSHDIDLINGAIIEDGFNVLKKGRIDLFFQMLFSVAIGRPDWLNMDDIMKIESHYDCKSVFYWIVNKGILNKRERNSDYDFKSSKIQKQLRMVSDAGFENGLHKSISHESFEEECNKFGAVPFGNRYHYLKFALPEAYHDIERAGIKLDASLGFAEQIGFRNNYGLPFNPYNFAERRPFNFVEVPLHIMDRTFFQYLKTNVKEAEERIIGFFEKHRENCVLSVLWHNNFFTDYKFKGYLDLYKKILSYIKDNEFKTITQEEIFDQYSITKA